jgi:hypothetical protein
MDRLSMGDATRARIEESDTPRALRVESAI